MAKLFVSNKLQHGDLEECATGSRQENDQRYRRMMIAMELEFEDKYEACFGLPRDAFLTSFRLAVEDPENDHAFSDWGSCLTEYIESLCNLACKSWEEAGRETDVRFYECLYSCFLEKRIDQKFEDLVKSIENEWRSGVEDSSVAIRTARLQAEKIKRSFKRLTDYGIARVGPKKAYE